jgi:hypothetical protein
MRVSVSGATRSTDCACPGVLINIADAANIASMQGRRNVMMPLPSRAPDTIMFPAGQAMKR